MPVTLWILEDQLDAHLPVLRDLPADGRVLMVESDTAWRRVPFHAWRITFLAAAMRHFADDLRQSGRQVAYYPLREDGYLDSISALRDHIRRTGSRDFVVIEPSEHHTRAWMETLPARLNITLRFVPNTLFLTDRDAFRTWAKGLKSPVMEPFYRRMRLQHRVLIEPDNTPAGGQWNLDRENRRPAPAGLLVPPPPSFEPDAITRAVMAEVRRRFDGHPGTVKGFDLPVTRTDALRSFDDFLRRRLPQFGEFEDAMVAGQPLLFHSLTSPLINAGLLRPLECVRAAEAEYRAGRAPLNSVEGFVRQILGWREYVYGIYWAFMPEYRERNARKAHRPLPQFFWDARTDLNCLKHCIGGVVERGYSHHIQRLMVICNFATLAGLSPQAVNDWFYALYVDSHDWVVTPNVIGMGMNADGGTMATKPYVSSAAYIDRMSDYCSGCRYDPRRRTGEGACPFNALYWSFLDEHAPALRRNPRMAMILKNLDRIDAPEMAEMRRSRDAFLGRLPAYPPPADSPRPARKTRGRAPK